MRVHPRRQRPSEEPEARRTRLASAYQSVFATLGADLVLEDLYDLIRPDVSAPHIVQDGVLHALYLAELDGRRAVWEHLAGRLQLSPYALIQRATQVEEDS